jgi:hypothetical protein
MTPKEKALELVSILCLSDCRDENITIAKQCALICVDEKIADALIYGDVNCAEGYLKEVKEEINKL